MSGEETRSGIICIYIGYWQACSALKMAVDIGKFFFFSFLYPTNKNRVICSHFDQVIQ